MKHALILTSLIILSCLSLSACSGGDDENKPRMQGERISILDLEKEIQPIEQTQDTANSIKVPETILNASWPQSGGNAQHILGNLSLGTGETQTIEKIWSADIGRGNTKRIPLNAQPIVADGRVFTLDTNNRLSAFHDQTGKLLWQKDVGRINEKENVINGGLAYDNGALYVASGYNEILALNPETSEIYWRTTLKAGSRAAPTILNGRVFVNTLNNELVALNAQTGEILWNYEGTEETTALLGAAAPTADDQIVVAAFSTGDLVALRVENGSTVWEDNLANRLRFGGMSGLSDIRALPVIAGQRVIAASYGGKMAAFDKNNGDRLWQQNIGSGHTPWVVGNTAYVLTTDYKLIALDITNGQVLWLSALDLYQNMKKRKNPLTWVGPIMANGHLVTMSTNGQFAEFDPKTGQKIREIRTGKNASLSPILANGTLFILDDNGKLSAYR